MNSVAAARGRERTAWLGAHAAEVILGALAVVAAVLLYRKGFGTTFYYDEWNFVMNRRSWDVDTFLRAHNEHLVLLPVLLFKVLFVTVGLDSYGVYRALLLAVHLICVGLVFVLVRQRLAPPFALAAAALLLFLGASWNNLLVPFQVAFLLSIAFGLGMLIALERRDFGGTVSVALLLAASLASSGVGIAFAAAAAVHVLVRDDRLRRLWAVAVPGLLFLAWMLAYGNPTATSGGRTLTELARDNLPATPGYIATAAAGAFGAITGLGLDWGRPLAVVGILLLAFHLAGQRALSLRLLALLAAAVTYWGVTAVLRSHVNPPTDSRYLYLGAVFVLLIGAELLPAIDPTPRLLAVLGVVVAAAAIANFGAVRSGSQFLQDWSRYVRAELGALELAGPDAPSTLVPDPVRAPDITAGRYFEAVRQYGSPASSRAEIARAGEPERQAADQVLLQGIRASVRPGGEAGKVAPSVVTADQGRATTRRGCVRFVPSGSGGTLEVAVPSPGLLLEGHGEELRLRSFADGFPQQPFAELQEGRHSLLISPRAGIRWQARLTARGPVLACSLAIT